MKFFTDPKTQIIYEIFNPSPSLKLASPRLNIKMLNMYAMYRNGIYESRVNTTLDPDVLNFRPQFPYTYENKTGNANNNLYHYASYIGIDAMQEMFKRENSKCCIAYNKSGKSKLPVGFVVFYEEMVDEKKMVYISHVSSGLLRAGIGTKLIQNIFKNHPEDTFFYLCARKSNVGGLACYERLGFVVDNTYVEKFGYNNWSLALYAARES